MDPDTCYADMIAAMAAGSYAVARELALQLRQSLAGNGPFPSHYTRAEVSDCISQVLRRTAAIESGRMGFVSYD